MAGNRWRDSRHDARIVQGEGPGQNPANSSTSQAVENNKVAVPEFSE